MRLDEHTPSRPLGGSRGLHLHSAAPLMRCMVSLFAIVQSTSSSAQDLHQWGVGVSSEHRNTDSIEAFLEIGNVAPQRWTLPLTRDDVGIIHSLDEVSSSGYGFDWNLAASYFPSTFNESLAVTVGTKIDGVENRTWGLFGGPFSHAGKLFNIQILVVDWTDDSVFVLGRVHSYMAPEPSTMWMVLGICICNALTRRKKKMVRTIVHENPFDAESTR